MNRLLYADIQYFTFFHFNKIILFSLGVLNILFEWLNIVYIGQLKEQLESSQLSS